MIVCAHCGVELDDGLNICPLCGWNPANTGKQQLHSVNNPSGIIRMHRNESRRHLWELFGVIAFSGIAVCTLVDLLLNRKPEWSLFSDIIILAVWIILTLFLFGYKRPWLILPGLLLTILAALLSIDLITGGTKWFFPAGLPITLAACISAGILFLLYRIIHLKGLNFIASVLMVSAGFCIITELILDHFLNGFVHLRWSLIVAVAILPVTLIFFFYHYRLKKGSQLDSFFHI